MISWHRFYDPSIGRYIIADPIGLAGGMNLYAYVGGNPVNAYDPEGLRVKWGSPTPTSPDNDKESDPNESDPNDCSGPCLDPDDFYTEGRWVWHAPYGDDCGYCECVSNNWYWDDRGFWEYGPIIRHHGPFNSDDMEPGIYETDVGTIYIPR